jgi:hypothetical protein
MSHGIQKETYVNADDETRHALTFDLLNGVYAKLEELTKEYKNHLGVCSDRFSKIENGKKKDTVLTSLFGLCGGIVAVLGQKLFGIK